MFILVDDLLVYTSWLGLKDVRPWTFQAYPQQIANMDSYPSF